MDQNNYQQIIAKYNETLKNIPSVEVIRFFLATYPGKIGFASSLGAEDQVITEMIAHLNNDTYIFTLDTGRLFPDAYDLIDLTEKRYGIKIQVYFPETGKVEKMVREKGINLFYESVENRKFCCNLRKIEPLKRALNGLEVWISGLRRDQSMTRQEAKLIEWDTANGMIKVNPLIDWTSEDLWKYIKEKNIPYNPLHDKGYPSIGCQPCTRAIEPGEDIREGRWWWEEDHHKECGLHKR